RPHLRSHGGQPPRERSGGPSLRAGARATRERGHCSCTIQSSRGHTFSRPWRQPMAEYQTAIIVDAPLEEVYNQWTQFEEFPRFMDGVLQVRQIDDKRLSWRARLGGVEKEWEAEITDQTPNRRIAWKSLSGARNAGAFLFERVPEGTHATLKLVY